MATTSIDVSVNSEWFTKLGTQVSYTDMVFHKNLYFAVDNGLNVIDVYSSGNYIRSFGTDFNKPLSITADDTYLYITDTVNNRIQVWLSNGTTETFVRNITNTLFTNIKYIRFTNDYLFLKQDFVNSFLLTTDGYIYRTITEYTESFIPSALSDGRILFYNPLNNNIVCLGLDYNFYRIEVTESFQHLLFRDSGDSEALIFGFTTNSSNYFAYTDYLTKIDVNSTVPANYTFNKIYYHQNLLIGFFGNSITAFNFVQNVRTNIFLTEFKIKTKELYPTGRAWSTGEGSNISRIHDALSISEANVHKNILDNLSYILPDTPDFNLEAIRRWEYILGIFANRSGTLEDRRNTIRQRIEIDRSIPIVGTAGNLQSTFTELGFNVTVRNNRYCTGVGRDETCSVVNIFYNFYGDDLTLSMKYNDDPVNGLFYLTNFGVSFTLCANYIDEIEDLGFIGPNPDSLTQTFFIGGDLTNPTNLLPADVPLSRKNEFRETILRYKPLHSVAVLFINYV